MPRAALTLPYNDIDLTGKQDIIFTVGGGPNLTATVLLPQSGAPGLPYGYYNYKNSSSSKPEALAFAVAAALTVTDTKVWSVTEASTGMPGRPRFTRAGAPIAVSFECNDPGTTFEMESIGFSSLLVYSGINQVTATWPAGRMFLPNRTTFSPRKPYRLVRAQTAIAGRVETRRLSVGYNRYRFRWSLLAPPRVLKWFGEQADWVLGVPDMVINDPNTAFEALWEWIDIRKPLRYHPDRDADTPFTVLVPNEQNQLSDLMLIAQDPQDLGANPLPNIDFNVIDFIA